MPRISRELANFLATDASGKPYRVFARQEFNVAYDSRGVSGSPAGPLRLNLADGTPVIRVRTGVYDISVGKVRLTSNDPSAV